MGEKELVFSIDENKHCPNQIYTNKIPDQKEVV